MSRKSDISPYGFIASFGLVSMLMDIVYEGALAVQGPLLLSLGASAALVGVISGLGAATSLAGRLVSGPAADHLGRYWLFAIAGYAITAITVPAMGLVGSVVAVSVLIVVERLGKSIRTPSRDTMLASASSAIGRGRGFALHEVLDQVGAVTGPLIVAGILWVTSNNYTPALVVLTIPGAAAIAILLRLRAKTPDPSRFEAASTDTVEGRTDEVGVSNPRLPKVFWAYAMTCGLCLAGVATFAVMSYHAVSVGALDAATVPVVYAVAMGVDALSALATGNLYDRVGPRTLLALPVLCALIPLFAYGNSLTSVIIAAMIWGLAVGVQESTMRACVADLVPQPLRATSYGVFSAFTGVGTLLGGTIAGALYAGSGTTSLVIWTFFVQMIVLVSLLMIFRACERKR